MVAGITASSSWQTERIQIVRPGDTVDLAGYEVTFRGAGNVPGPNYTALRGTFDLTANGRKITTLYPEKRAYPAEKSNTTEAAIHTTPLADVYVVLGDPDGKGGWATRMYHNPLVPWIWAGAIFMAIGGMVSLSDRRLRVGAPKRAARKSPAAEAA